MIDAQCLGRRLRVGYWDDSGWLSKVEALVNGVPLAPAATNLRNGSFVFTGLNLAGSDRILVRAEDQEGNRQMYEKKVQELLDECEPTIIVETGPALPWP